MCEQNQAQKDFQKQVNYYESVTYYMIKVEKVHAVFR